MQSDDPLANDRTQFMPRPGGRGPQPATPASAPPAPPLNVPAEPLAPGQAVGMNPLEQAAGPLLALLTRLRNTIAHRTDTGLWTSNLNNKSKETTH